MRLTNEIFFARTHYSFRLSDLDFLVDLSYTSRLSTDRLSNLPTYIPIYLLVCLLTYLPTYLLAFLLVCLPACLLVCLPACLPAVASIGKSITYRAPYLLLFFSPSRSIFRLFSLLLIYIINVIYRSIFFFFFSLKDLI